MTAIIARQANAEAPVVADGETGRRETPRAGGRGRRAASTVLLLVAIGAAVAGGLGPGLDLAVVASLVLIGAGLLVVLAAPDLPTGRGAERRHWVVVGSGLLVAGLGALPLLPAGVATGAGIAGYGLSLGGLAALTRPGRSRVGWLRLGLDVAVFTVGVVALLAERLAPAGTAAGDLAVDALLVAVFALCVLGATPRLDGFLAAFGLGSLAVLAGRLAGGSAGPAVEIAGYGAFALSARLIRTPGRAVGSGEAAWRHVLPYVPVAVLLVVLGARAAAAVGLAGPLPVGLVGVLVLLVVRQATAIRENRELVEAERDRLIAAVSHELRTPLTAVAGFADVLDGTWDEITDVERRDMVGIVKAQSRYLAGIVTDMSLLVHDELERIELDRRRFSGRSLVAEAVAAVYDLSEGPPPVKARVEPYLEIVGDRDRLVQVLTALLVNAQRYGRGRTLVVALRGEGTRIIEVHDDGAGVDERFTDVVWERFERGAHRLDERVPGSGLGLAIVRSLARAHGGRVAYRRSEELGGACFSVEIPYDPTADR